jgi:hypothetical protein
MQLKQTKTPELSQDAKFILSKFEEKFSHLENTILENSPIKIPEMLKPNQVCEKMGWSRSKFEQFKRDGFFKTFKIGGLVYVYTSDLVKLFPKDF